MPPTPTPAGAGAKALEYGRNDTGAFPASWAYPFFTMSRKPPRIAAKPYSSTLDVDRVWWSQTGSNRRPPACKAGALPTELWPRLVPFPGKGCNRNGRSHHQEVVGLERFELSTSRL